MVESAGFVLTINFAAFMLASTLKQKTQYSARVSPSPPTQQNKNQVMS